MPATLRLTRETSFAFELQRGIFDITIDGQNAGTVENHETVEKSLDPGHHTLRLRKGRYSSQDHPFDVADGEVVLFRCHGASLWPRYVASLVRPDLAIALHIE